MSIAQLRMGQFLKERPNRLLPGEANSSGLKRLEKIDFKGNIHISESKPTKTNMILVKKGDFVISGINAEKGAVAVYRGDEDLVATIHYSSYLYDQKMIDVDYLKWLLKSSYFSKTLIVNTKGGIKTEIKAKKLLQLELKIPDLSIQHKIANRITQADQHIAELRSINHEDFIKYEKLRGMVLEGAVKGAYRSTEMGESALEELIELGIEPAEPDYLPFEIPDNWTWCTLDSLVNHDRGITYGIIKLGAEPKSGVPTLRCSDVKFRHIDTSKIRLVDEELSRQYSRTVLQGGEIVMNIRGTLGGCSIVPDEMSGFNIAREVAMIPIVQGISKEYILNVLTSPYFIAGTLGNLRGTAYKGLNLSILRKLPIPLPPYKQQEIINDKVKALLEDINKVEKVASIQLSKISQLAKATIDTEINKSISEKTIKAASPNPTFAIQQAIGALLNKGFKKGEMAIAKVLYLLQEVYGIPIGIQFTRQNFGPYDSAVKVALTSGLSYKNKFFIKSGQQANIFYELNKNGQKILKYKLSQDASEALNDLLPKLKKAKSSDIERLASVCKVIQDNKTIDADEIQEHMKRWKPDKFTREQILKSLNFIKSKKWDKKLLK